MAPTPQWKVPAEILENRWGFDKTAMPPWFMVGHRSDKTLLLDFAMGKLVKSDRPHIVEVKEVGMVGQSREFWIKGKIPGPARIEVRDPSTNRVEAVLDVLVKTPRQYAISFHFVEDKAGDATNRKFEDVEGIIAKLNDIYTSQTNVEFQLGSASPLKVDMYLHDVLEARTNNNGERLSSPAFIYGEKTWRKIFATKDDRRARFNFYFVPAKEPNNRNDLLFFDLANCVIEDGVGAMVEFLVPHAIGRMFGCAPTSHDALRHHLMFWGRSGPTHFFPSRGGFIPKACVNLMNP